MSFNGREVALGELLTRVRNEVVVQEQQTYSRLTIRLNGKGITLRDRLPGHEIGTKRQFIARTGQLVLSKIDARNGAFGILPPECDNAIITGNFWAFDIRTDRLERQYFYWLTRTPLFVDFCIRASEGTTNRRYLQEDQFLAQRILLPPLDEQRSISARIEEIAATLDEVRRLREEVEASLVKMLDAAFRRITESAPRKPLKAVAPLTRRPAAVDPSKTYPQVSVRSFGKGTFQRRGLSGDEITWQQPYLVRANDILISNIKAWEGAIAVAKPEDDGRYGSHRYLTCVPVANVATSNFVCFYLLTPEGLEEVGRASPGSTDRNRTLSSKRLQEIMVPVPPHDRQVWFDALCERADLIRQSRTRAAPSDLEAMLTAVLQQFISPPQAL